MRGETDVGRIGAHFDRESHLGDQVAGIGADDTGLVCVERSAPAVVLLLPVVFRTRAFAPAAPAVQHVPEASSWNL